MIRGDADFKRIERLPRRPGVPTPLTLGGLLPAQQMALGAFKEAVEAGPCYGALIQMHVGEGKTLVSFLAPRIFGVERYVLVVIPSLKQKTQREWHEYKAAGFDLPPLKMVTHWEMSNVRGCLPEDLELLIVDEIAEFRRPSSGRTKYLLDYVYQNPMTRFVGLAADFTTSSVLDLQHLAELSHRDRSPLPRSFYAARDWSESLDPDGDGRVKLVLGWPGAEGEGNAIHRARRAVAQRISETPGIYVQPNKPRNVPIDFFEWPCKLPPECAQALIELEATWVRPDGHQLLMASEWSTAARTISLGFYHQWEEYPEQWWYDARTEANTFIKNRLRGGVRRGLLTEGDVVQRYYSAPELARWREAEEEFKPKTRVVWIDDGLCKQAAEWACDMEGRLVWVSHPEVGEKIAKVAPSRLLYYGAGSKKGERLEKESGSAVASRRSHSVGRNLQYRFHECLFFEAPVSARAWEQAIGRVRRTGQTEKVKIHAPLHTDALRRPFDKTLEQAVYLSNNSQPQSLLDAEWYLCHGGAGALVDGSRLKGQG